MRLEELLKFPEGESNWPPQRRRLLRFLSVAGVCAVLLIAVAVWTSRRAQNKIAPPQSETLAGLMKIRDDANELRSELDMYRRASPGAFELNEEPRRRPAARANTRNVPNQQIFNYDPGDGFSNIVNEEERPYIPTGSVFIAELITPIKTSVERTFVMAETTHEFRIDMKRKIPKKSRLIGRSRLNPVLKGVIVEFDMLVLPNGIETPLSGLALSRNALPEIDGLYFSNDLETYGAALAFGFLSGFTAGARETEPTIYGSQPEVNLRNQVLGGLSTASFQVAEDILRDVQRRAVEYVVVPAGEKIFIALTRKYEVQNENKDNE